MVHLVLKLVLELVFKTKRLATALKDSTSPYLLRRTKADVKTVIDLPQKNEQVVFCQLSEQQRQMYEEYLASDETRKVMNGIVQISVGLMQLRKLSSGSVPFCRIHWKRQHDTSQSMQLWDRKIMKRLTYDYWCRHSERVWLLEAFKEDDRG